MPNIDAIQPVFYQTLWPYYVHYDNIPLQNIVTREELINNAVENQRKILNDAVGSQGTLAARLGMALNEDGTLRTDAVNNTWHSIAYHEDGVYNDGISIISYVRMTATERAKLALLADDATSLAIQVETPSNIILFDNTTIELIASDTVTWNVRQPNHIEAHLTFPTTALHNHQYDQTPVHDNLLSPDYQTYKVNSLATAFKEDTLRVYINGMRLTATGFVYVPSAGGPSEDWYLMSYTPDSANGTFTLNRQITALDVIRIDYDLEFSS